MISFIEGFKPLYQDAPLVSETNVMPTELRQKEAPFRYEHLSEARQQTIEAILKGFHPLETLPVIESRVIRVYVSSTYTGAYIVNFII